MNLNQLKRLIATKTNAYYEERHHRFAHSAVLALHYADNPLYSPEHEGHHHVRASVFLDDDTYYAITWCADTDAYHWEKWMDQMTHEVINAPESDSEVLDHLRTVTTYGDSIWGVSSPSERVFVCKIFRDTKTKRIEPIPVSAYTSQYDVSL